MPKIIEDAKESILHCTRKHLSETGYASLSLRLIAKECHLGVGTIYNYFSSKDDLVAQIMLEDWFKCLAEMDRHIVTAIDAETGLIQIQQILKNYCIQYESLFKEAESSAHVVSSRHDLLVSQMKERIQKLLNQFDQNDDYSVLLAEIMLISATKNTINDLHFKKAIHQLLRKEHHNEQL
jgi:AcrR family transcriptional regulator